MPISSVVLEGYGPGGSIPLVVLSGFGSGSEPAEVGCPPFDLSEPLRTAILANADITALLPAYQGTFPVFTRRPVNRDAPYPMIVISQDITIGDEDGINDHRPLIARDIAVYHTNELAANYRLADDIAFLVRAMFNRKRHVFTVDGWEVVRVRAAVPTAVELPLLQTTGRIVQLSVLLACNEEHA